MYANTKMLVL